MRHRIRERAEVEYQVARSNASWWEHRVRTLTTAGLISFLEPGSVLDPACGDASLVLAASRIRPISRATLVDISAPSIAAVAEAITAPWEARVGDAVEELEAAARDGRHYDAVILTEFLEHVPDPDQILRLAKPVATWLVASSPLLDDPHRDDDNPEHLWAFDNEGYHDMLMGAGWEPWVYQGLMLHGGHYNFQVWACR